MISDAELTQLELEDRDLTLEELRDLKHIVSNALKRDHIASSYPKYKTLLLINGWANANGADTVSVAWRLLDEHAQNFLEYLIEDFISPKD